MMTDPIADMLTRIRNAQRAKKASVSIPFSNMKLAIAKILLAGNYVGDIEIIELHPKQLVIKLKYQGGRPVITSLKRESKPGHRKYYKASELPRVLNDYGIAIVSTSSGIMSSKDARVQGVGGEVICTVY